jgi:hypothetical protein
MDEIEMPEKNSEVISGDINKQDPAVKGNFLLKYAILAPSYHNSQPWRFKARSNEITIFGDLRRWHEIEDADQRELYTSIGCALENILIAAEHFGYSHSVSYLEGEQVAAVVCLNPSGKPSSFRDDQLFPAMAKRRTIKKIYENRALPQEAILRLQEVCIEEGFKLYLAEDIDIKKRAKELIHEAYAFQQLRAAIIKGKPRTMLRISQKIVDCLNLSGNEAKKDLEILMSAPIIATMTSENNGHRSQITAGQILERIWLKASALGIIPYPMSCILQVPELREKAFDLLPVADVCLQQIFLLGYAEANEKNISRRSLQEFLI